jgi:anti-sigma B factor antagonist
VGAMRMREEPSVERVSVGARADGTLDVVLLGEVDFTNASETIDAIRDAVTREQPIRVRVDMSDVTFLDSSGVAVLVNAKRAAEAVGASYRVERPNQKVLDQLRMMGLLEPFGIAES